MIGDAHGVVPLSWFVGKVPVVWLDEMIRADSVREHCVVDWARTEGNELGIVHGVNSLDFHYWFAYRIVWNVDRGFDATIRRESGFK